MFVGRRRFVEAQCDRWFVLSAKHGLLDPDEVIEPYDVALTELAPAVQRAWSDGVLAGLRSRLGELSGVEFEVHAGAAYRDNGVVSGLRAAGATVENPTEGLNFGQQLAFYATGSRPMPSRPAVGPGRRAGGPGRPRAGYGLIGEMLDDVDGQSVTVSFAELEAVLGRPLPASARRYPTWWGNTEQSPQGRGWLHRGWRVGRVRTGSGEVRFDRAGVRTTGSTAPSARPGPGTDPAPTVGPTRSPPEMHLEDVRPIGPFTYRWPDTTESFERGWEATVEAGGARHRL